MHIPDGYLSPSTCAAFYGASAPMWYLAARRVSRLWHTQVIPLISVFAAFCFVVMMFNLPLPGGTTGHAVGMGVAAIVLGPWAAMLSISMALFVQAIFFGDGGITAFGANCFNMAIVGSLTAYAVYRLIAYRCGLGSYRRVMAAALAGYAAINAAALCAAIELGMQPLLFHDGAGAPLYAPYPLSISIPAMMVGHLTFAGLAESVLTGSVVAYLQHSDSRLLRADSRHPFRWRKALAVVAILAALTPLGILATGSAWGEWRPRELARAPAGLVRLYHIWPAPLPQYSPSFIGSVRWGYAVSAAMGVGVILLLGLAMFLIGRLRERRRGATFLERTISSFLAAAGHAFSAEELAREDGFLQRIDARVKLAGLLALIVSAIAVRRWPFLLALLGIAIILALASRAGFRTLLFRVWLPVLAFTGVIALPAVFLAPGGWEAALRLILRAGTAATFSILLVLCTPWTHVLKALRFFRTPPVLVVVLGMTHRYIFLLLKSAQEMFEGRQSRLVGVLEPADSRRMAAASAGVLLLKSFELSGDVHLAMLSRGFTGEIHMLDEARVGAKGWIQLAAFLGVACAAIWLGR